MCGSLIRPGQPTRVRVNRGRVPKGPSKEGVLAIGGEYSGRFEGEGDLLGGEEELDSAGWKGLPGPLRGAAAPRSLPLRRLLGILDF